MASSFPIKIAAKPLLMETWLPLTIYKKLPAFSIRWYHGRPFTTYRLDKIPHDWHTILRYDPSKSSKVNDFHHRLNGSSSHVLTATSLSYGKAKNSTRHRIKTADLIEIKFGTVDYVG